MGNGVVQAERAWYFSHVGSVKGRGEVVRFYLYVGVASGSGQQEGSSCAQELEATARVQCWQPEAKTTGVEAHIATYLWFVQLWTFNSCSQWRKSWRVVEVISGSKGHA